MTNVLLLVGSQRTSHESLTETIRGLRDRGATVSLATRVLPADDLRDACDAVTVIGTGLSSVAVLNAQVAAAAAAAGTSVPPPPPAGAARVRAAVEWRARRARRGLSRRTAKVRRTVVEPARCWADLRRSAGALALAAEADVICAVDTPMLRAAWLLGQRYPDPEVVFGLASVDGAIARSARDQSA